MDRNAPAALTDTAQQGYDESKRADREMAWPRPAAVRRDAAIRGLEHAGTDGDGRAVVGRTSGHLPAVARRREPRRSGLDPQAVSASARATSTSTITIGQLGPRAIYGHGIWLTEEELRRCHDTGTAIAHCPTSNQFLGSGLFSVANAVKRERPVRVALATDLGAGTSFSMLQTLDAAYQVAQLKGESLSAPQAFYLATRGAARALYLEDRIGSIAPGMEADLVVLDLKSTSADRLPHARLPSPRGGVVHPDDPGRRPRDRVHLHRGFAGASSADRRAAPPEHVTLASLFAR